MLLDMSHLHMLLLKSGVQTLYFFLMRESKWVVTFKIWTQVSSAIVYSPHRRQSTILDVLINVTRSKGHSCKFLVQCVILWLGNDFRMLNCSKTIFHRSSGLSVFGSSLSLFFFLVILLKEKKNKKIETFFIKIKGAENTLNLWNHLKKCLFGSNWETGSEW